MAPAKAVKLKSLPLSQVYRLLEPGPVVMVTVGDHRMRNVMTLSWHTMMDFDPPVIGICLGERNYTFGLLKSLKRCVIAVPTVEMASTMVKVGNCSGRDVNKFRKFGITIHQGSAVRAPILPQCWANIECVVTDMGWVKKYNFFVLKAVKAWVNPSIKSPRTLHHRGRGYFEVTGKTIKLPSKMK
jgi:flavin reductase (DIM6/NTAB) family NADH-FMN oxidoreductase RutF